MIPYGGLTISYGPDTSGKPLDLSSIQILDADSRKPASVEAGQTFGVALPYGGDLGRQSNYTSASTTAGDGSGFRYKDVTARNGQQIYLFQAPAQQADMKLTFSTRELNTADPSWSNKTVQVRVR